MIMANDGLLQPINATFNTLQHTQSMPCNLNDELLTRRIGPNHSRDEDNTHINARHPSILCHFFHTPSI